MQKPLRELATRTPPAAQNQLQYKWITMQKLVVCLIILFLLLGCTQKQPNGTDQNSNPDQNTGFDWNALDALKDLNRTLKGDKTISINFDQNKIMLNFDFNLSLDNQDVNTLIEACSSTCDVIDADKWSLKKDLNYSSWNCYCTKITCTDVEEQNQITRYCRPDTIGLKFELGNN